MTTSPRRRSNYLGLPQKRWPDNPLLLCTHPLHQHYIHTPHDSNVAIPVNKVFEFESKSFKGSVILRVIDAPTTNKTYFKNRRRKMDFTIQGQFLRRIRFDKVYTGQVFDGKFRNIPGKYLVSAALKLVRSLAPSLRCDIDGNNPHLISSLASAAQTINISKIGNEKKLPLESQEDMTLLSNNFKNLGFQKRKSLMSSTEELKKYYYEPNYIWTMSFYSHMISPQHYQLLMLMNKFSIEKYISAPMQINAMIEDEDDTTNDYTNSNVSTNSSFIKNKDKDSKETKDNKNNKDSKNNEQNTQKNSKNNEKIEKISKNNNKSNRSLINNEYIWNFQLWHVKLVNELDIKCTNPKYILEDEKLDENLNISQNENNNTNNESKSSWKTKLFKKSNN